MTIIYVMIYCFNLSKGVTPSVLFSRPETILTGGVTRNLIGSGLIMYIEKTNVRKTLQRDNRDTGVSGFTTSFTLVLLKTVDEGEVEEIGEVGVERIEECIQSGP